MEQWPSRGPNQPSEHAEAIHARTRGYRPPPSSSVAAASAHTLRKSPLRNIDSGKRHAYDPDAIARGGVFVVLNHDGTARIERGLVRPEDEAPEPEPEAESEGEGYAITEDGDEDRVSASEPEEVDAEEDRKPLSDLLIRDLTAHRTLGLRLALSEQPDIALITVTHTLAAQTFYRAAEAHCLDIRPANAYLASHADRIEDTAADLPRGVADLCVGVSRKRRLLRQALDRLWGVDSGAQSLGG
jgi:hypothetical protein